MKVFPTELAEPAALEPFSRIRLIVADLDGTLLDSSNEVIELIQGHIKKLRKNNIKFTIATGRTFEGVEGFLPRLELTKKMPIALYNGSLCIENFTKKILYSRLIPSSIVREVAEIAYYLGFSSLCFPGPESTLYKALSPYVVTAPTRVAPSDPNGKAVIDIAVNSTSLLPDCLAILLLIEEQPLDDILRQLSCVSGISSTKSGSKYIEIRPYGSDKGKALEEISRRLNVPVDSVLAIGDNDNDIEMLTSAGLKVAVGNASQKLLSVADYSTPLNAAKGCLQVLRLIIQSRRYYPNN